MFSFINTLNFQKLTIFLFSLSVLLYINSINNQYALDDEIVILESNYIKQGVKGLPGIFTSDMFDSFFKNNNSDQTLSGGRYRPLSIATFAIDFELFEDNPMPKHFINVLLYGLLVIILFRFLVQTLRLSLWSAFFVSFLFAIHPIHTEVVANIKSRDEILSAIFYLLTLSKFIDFNNGNKIKDLLLSLLYFALALLSKEYAITLLAIIPISAIVINQTTLLKAIKSVWPYFLVFGLYAFLRIQMLGLVGEIQTEPLNNPYIFADKSQKFATSVFVLLKYFKLMIWPYPLSADYSYPQIAYKNLSDLSFWLSAILHLSLIIWFIKSIFQKSLIAIALGIYLLNLALIGNFIFDIGATMGERLAFHSSIGFCLLLVLLFEKIVAKIQTNKRVVLLTGISLLLLILSITVVIPRNEAWFDSDSLFLVDVETVPNSSLTNSNAAVAYIKKTVNLNDSAAKQIYFEKAKYYSEKAIQLHPTYVNAHINYALSCLRLNLYEPSINSYLIAKSLYPSNPVLQRNAVNLYKEGLNAGAKKDFQLAVFLIESATKLDDTNADFWADLGGAYFSLNNLEKAKENWRKALSLNPENEHAKKALNYFDSLENQ